MVDQKLYLEWALPAEVSRAVPEMLPSLTHQVDDVLHHVFGLFGDPALMSEGMQLHAVPEPQQLLPGLII